VTGFIAGREARLRKKYEDLSTKLEKSYRRLHKQAKMLLEVEEQLGASQRLSALGRLSASLAHEIKNPLSSIRGTAEIFLDEFPEGHPKREFAQILIKEVNRLNKTVMDVLQFSRGKTGSAQQQEPLAEVLERVLKLLEAHLRKKRIVLDAKGIEEGINVSVDGDKMSQVLLNLFLNSIDALEAGAGGRIWLQVTAATEGIVITVSDNGPGIGEQDRKRIFTPFVTTKDGGTGLGLPISRRIVETYGGTLTFQPSESGGASFQIFLPREQKSPQQQLLNGAPDHKMTVTDGLNLEKG